MNNEQWVVKLCNAKFLSSSKKNNLVQPALVAQAVVEINQEIQ